MPNLVTIRNYADGQILFKVHLDQFLDSIEDWANDIKLDSVNIQNGGVSTDNLADLSVTAAKLNTASVTTAKLAQDVSERLMPAGAIQAYAGTAAPTGWLLCDGSMVSRTVYSALFAVIGESFGEGDNASTFHLPDLRGRFLRGRDAGAARDPDAAGRTAMNTGGNTGDNIGSIQGQATATNGLTHNHNHQLPVNIGTGQVGPRFILVGSTSIGGAYGFGPTFPTDLPNTGISGDNETRPLNVNINYIIKT